MGNLICIRGFTVGWVAVVGVGAAQLVKSDSIRMKKTIFLLKMFSID
jgi:hypothetical protein